MLLIAAVPAAVATRHPAAIGRLIQAAALAGLLCALGAALVATLAEPATPATLVVLGTDTGQIPLALSVLADSLTFTILGLVSLLVAIIARYSTNYLAGEAAQGTLAGLDAKAGVAHRATRKRSGRPADDDHQGNSKQDDQDQDE